ncbi:MAG: hypothetical protein K8S99_06750 [Planctomycetes bacterium]|nr:hypothetical protein [Planctomycetota bacterium]
MTEIFSESFAAPGLPAGWYTDTPFPKYTAGGWDCRGWDGVVTPFPHDAWRSLRVEVDLGDIGPNASAFCGTDSRTSLYVSLSSDPATRHQAGDGGLVITQGATRAPVEDGVARLVFEWTAQRMRASVNGVEVLTSPNMRGSARAGGLQLGFRGCVVRRIAAYGEPEDKISPPQRAIRPGFPLEVTVDFNDDLMPCAWTHKTFDALFVELKSWGTKRVSWIDLGRAADGYFDFAPYGIDKTGLETLRNVGDIFATAVKHAHGHGIELIGIIKPYDMAIQGISWPPLSHEGRTRGRIHRIGTSTGWSTRMAAENQHLIMARKPSACGPAKYAAWTRIDLVKDDDARAAISPDDISLIVSDDNQTFRPYAGPVTRRETVEEYPVYRCTPSGPAPTGVKRRSRVFRFEGLELREPFVAMQVKGNARSFSNRFCDLIHVFGEQGEETHLTYGLTPRRADHVVLFEQSPASVDPSRPPVGPQGGFEYNRYPGSPSGSLTCGGDPINTPLALDRGSVSYLALARGKDRGPLAVMSPSFPETRALWMTWVAAMFDAGADGIDIRPGHHHADFAWGEYGFEEPVRAEMLRRTGVDIWQTDDFDHDLWRRVRGDGWTQFIREAAAVVRARGKKIVLHIDGHFDHAPGTGAAMNMVCDWRTWLEEGLADRVTGKALWPGASFSREVVALAHAKGVPVSFTPYCNNFFEDRSTMNHSGDSPRGCEIPVDRLIRWGREAGYDGFTFYECASALRAAADGSVRPRPGAEPFGAMMKRHFTA